MARRGHPRRGGGGAVAGAAMISSAKKSAARGNSLEPCPHRWSTGTSPLKSSAPPRRKSIFRARLRIFSKSLELSSSTGRGPRTVDLSVSTKSPTRRLSTLVSPYARHSNPRMKELN